MTFRFKKLRTYTAKAALAATLICVTTSVTAQEYRSRISNVEMPQALTIGLTDNPILAHPILGQPNFSLGFTLRPIVAFNDALDLTCILCRELPTVENGNLKMVDEKQQVTFTLPANLYWGDSTPVSSNDVVFTWQIGKTQRQADSRFRLIEEVIINDEYTFTVVWQKDATYPGTDVPLNPVDLTFFWPVAAHVEQFAFRKPSQYAKESRYYKTPNDPGLYLGPYILGSQAEKELGFELNPAWKLNTVDIDQISVKAFADKSSLHEIYFTKRTAPLKAFDFQKDKEKYSAYKYIPRAMPKPAFIGTTLIPPGQITLQDALKNQDIYSIAKSATLGNSLIYLQTMAGRELQKILLAAIDRAEINTLALDNLASLADRILPASDKKSALYTEQSVIELLMAAGWQQGEDQQWYPTKKPAEPTAETSNTEMVEGALQPLTINFVSVEGPHFLALLQQLIVDDWQQAGFKVNMINPDALLLQRQAPPPATLTVDLHREHFPADTVDAMISEQAGRVIPLFHEPMVYGISKSLENVELLGSPLSLKAENWTVKRPSRYW